MLAIFLLILNLIPLFIYNNAIVDASGNENEDLDVEKIRVVYKSILFDDMKNFKDEEHMEYFQKEIALFFYKKFCWSILNNYEHLETETEEFRSHFQQIQENYHKYSEQKALLESKICDFYKMFVRIILDKILEKSEHWRQYLRFNIRHFFWLDNQWKIKMEEFLKNLNWQSKENCTVRECENLIEYLAENLQIYAANYWSLKWLFDNSSEFIGTVKTKSDVEFGEMKRRIFSLTGHIGFDRLELAKMDVMKIETPISEFVHICLKRYLIGAEDSKRSQLRISISLLLNIFLKFRQKMAAGEKKTKDENFREFLAGNLVKFDLITYKINELLSSIADLNEVNFAQEEVLLGLACCILLKLFEISDGTPTLKSKSFMETSEEELLNITNLDLELMETKSEKILVPHYLGVIEKELEKADTEMQNILQNVIGSIFRLASLIGGSDNFRKIWEKYKEKIRSIDYFSIDFDKRTRIYYEILFNEKNEKIQILSRTILNIFLLMNSVEKLLQNNKSFELLLEDWRYMMRLKIDHLHVKSESLAKNNIEMTYKGNIILEFVEKWKCKKGSAKKIRDEFYKFDKRNSKEIYELFNLLENIEKEYMEKNDQYDEFELLKNQNVFLSSRFQNIHIEQLVKLAEEDKQKKINNDNEAKTFNFWLFFQKLLSNRDKKLLINLGLILNDNNEIEKLMKEISKLSKIEEIQTVDEKLKPGKKKKKTATRQSLPQEEELQGDMTAESSSKRKESQQESLGKSTSADVKLHHHPMKQSILHPISSGQASHADIPIPSTEIYQNILYEEDLELVLNASEQLRICVIDSYLEMLIRDNTQNYGFIPSYVIDCFRREEIFPPEWLKRILEQKLVNNVKYWLIPAHLNEDHWVLAVMNMHENKLYYFDSWQPGNINDEYTTDILTMFHFLYTLSGHAPSVEYEYMSRTDLPKQKNSIDCGVFMLMYARDIFEQNNMDAIMHINQSGIKEARKRIFRELMADRFETVVDSDVLETLYILYSSPKASRINEKKLSELKESQNEADQKSSKNVQQSQIKNTREKPKISLQSQKEKSSNVSSLSKLERLRSLHEIPKEEPKNKGLKKVKFWYYERIFDNGFDESSNVNVAIFHLTNLMNYMLKDFKKHMANSDEQFRKEIDAKFDEHRELLKLYGNYTEEFLCIFFKFFMRLTMNKILAENKEWNRYLRFRMRHFYWIDPKWVTNAKILIMEQINKCTEEEIKQVSQNIANVRPFSSISHWWTLKWLFQRSPEFIEEFNNYYKEQEIFLILKKRIFDLVGVNGFERLEMAIPVLRFHVLIEDMARISIIRFFFGGLEGTKYELRLALSYSLNLFVEFREKYNINFGGDENKALLNIYEHIVNVKLAQLVDAEYTLEEEVYELKEALCIILKFFEISETEIMMTTEKVFSISYERALQCTDDEIESTMKSQRLMLKFYHYNLMEKYLSTGDEYLENILKYKDGAIYQLKELIGYDNLLELWNNYREKIRDKKYFTNTLNQIRESFELFITTKDAQIRQLNKTKLKIYILMRWLDHTLQKYDRSFGGLLSRWHVLFRANLDQLTVHPNQVNKVEIDCTFRGENIIEFLNKWKLKTRDEHLIRKEYDLEQEKIDNFIDNFNTNEALPLMDGFQLILVETLQALINEDKKTNKTKTDTEKAKGINILQYFKDLQNHVDRIARIGELLNIDFLKHLYEQLGIKFIASQFSQLGELSGPKIDLLIDEVNPLKKYSPHLIENQQQEGGPTKSTKKKTRKKNKSKMNTISTEDEEKIGINESEIPKEKIENVIQEISQEKTLAGKGSAKEKGKKLEEKESTKEIKETSSPKENAKKVLGKSYKIVEGKEGKQKHLKNLKKFNEEFGEQKLTQIGMPLIRQKSAPNGSQIQNGITQRKLQAPEITNFPRSSRSQSVGKQRPKGDQIVKLYILNGYKFAEKHRLTDITVFAFEIGQRLKALELHTKLWNDNNKIDFENIQKEIKIFEINRFKDINELEEALYNLLKRIEFAIENPINLENNKKINIKNIFETRKQLHKLRLSWIIQNDPSWHQTLRNKDINHILFTLNLDGKSFNEQIKIWQTIIEQIKLDHDLYVERRIEEKGNRNDIFDFAKYSQHLYFDDQHEREENLTEKLIEEFKFVDVKNIERGEPIKYLWMRKYMETKERIIKFVKEWHSTAEILFTGSHLLGTMTSRSDMDTIVVTYDVQIHEYNQQAECIVEEIGFDEQMKMQRRRQCENDQLFICQLCKMSRVISVVKIKGLMELLKAFICEDGNYESKSFNECKYKVKVDFLFATLPKKENLSILKRKEVTSDEMDEILKYIYKFNKPSFFALLGLRDNLRIIELFPNDGKNFRIASAALKLWAKRNNIYGPKLGFLKGVHMNLLMVKIYLRYPSASVSFLIEQFFATYIVWPWPMPVQLLPMSEITYEESRIIDFKGNPQQYLLWYIKEPNAQMPIISPGYIESNKASDVDRYTKSIMRTFMSEGLKQIREIRFGKVIKSRNEWHNFMRGNNLAERYTHFLVISCLTKVNGGTFGDDFCAIVSLKIHDFIPTDIGKLLPKEIRWYHIIEAGSRKECLINRDGYEYEDISKYKCDVWLVGLQLKKDKQIVPEEMINLENTKEMNEAKGKMYNDYINYKKRFDVKWRKIGEHDENSIKEKLFLAINYVGVNDLQKWYIHLRGWEVNVKN